MKIRNAFILLYTFSSLTILAQNAFVAVASSGGMDASSPGSVLRFNLDGTGYQVIRTLKSSDGYRNPLIDPGDGYLYGGTVFNGTWKDSSFVYKIKPDGSEFTILKTLGQTNSAQDGRGQSGPMLYHEGRLYGVNHSGGPNGKGTLYSILKDGKDYRRLKFFNSADINGFEPTQGMVPGPDGFLYGTTKTRHATIPGVIGTIYRIRPDGTMYETLHAFSVPAETGPPGSPLNFIGPTALSFGPDGKLYGAYRNYESRNGMIFRMNADGSDFTIIHRFDATQEGYCNGGLTLANNGILYGATALKGIHGNGIMFKIENGQFSKICDFPSDWGQPLASFTQVDNYLWNSGSYGGASGKGVVFKFNLLTGELTKVLDLTNAIGYGLTTLTPVTIDPNGLCIPTAVRLNTSMPAAVTPSSMIVTWNKVLDAESYRVDVSLSPDFSSMVEGYNDLKVTENRITITGLSPLTLYHIRVRAAKGSIRSSHSEVLSRVTAQAGPVEILAVSNVYNTFQASWQALTGARSIFYEVAYDPNFSSIMVRRAVGGSENNVSIDVPCPGTYYFRAQTYSVPNPENLGSYSPFSPPVAVTTPSFGAPVRLSATEVSFDSFIAAWAKVDGALSYSVDVATEPDFSVLLPGYANVPVTHCNLAINNLQNNSTYYFRVRAHDGQHVSDNSGTYSVTTGLKSPVLLPVTGQSQTSFTINWLPVAGASGYRVEVSPFLNFPSSDTRVLVAQHGSTSVVVSDLLPGGSTVSNYHFRIRSFHAEIVSPFTTGPLVKMHSNMLADQSINFSPVPVGKKYRDMPFLLTATASSGLSVSFSSSNTAVATISGSTVTITGPGRTTITASQSGTINVVNPAPNISQTLIIEPGDQTINFPEIPTKQPGDPEFLLLAQASSKLPVSYASSNPDVAAISGNKVKIIGVGSTVIAATQNGDVFGNFNAAPTEFQTLVVVPDCFTPQPPSLQLSQPTCLEENGSIAVDIQMEDDVYSFDNGQSFQHENVKPGLSPGVYHVQIKNKSGCVSETANAVINQPPPRPPLPVILVTGPTCTERTGSIRFDAWEEGDMFSFDNGNTFQVEATMPGVSPGEYTTYIRNVWGCLSDPVTVIVDKAPAQPAIPVLTVVQPSCSSTFSAITVEIQNSSDTYSFDNGATYQSNNSRTGLTPGAYHINVRNAAQCTSPVAVASIHTPPDIPGLPIAGVTHPDCNNLTGTIVIEPKDDGSQFSFDNGITFQEANVMSQLVAGAYDLVILSKDGCRSATKTVSLNHVTVPTKPVIRAAASATGIELSTDAASGYKWFMNGMEMADARQPRVAVVSAGIYTVVITSSDGCESMPSDPWVITGSDDGIPDEAVKLFPNPANDYLVLQQVPAHAVVVVKNLNGASVDCPSYNDGPDFVVNVNGLAAGIYVVEISDGQKMFRRRFIKI